MQAQPEASDQAAEWIALLRDIGVVGGIVGAMILASVGWFVRFWRKTRPIRDEFARRETLRASLTCSSRTAKLLQDWAKRTGAMRAILICAENCMFQQPAQHYRITVTIEAAACGIPSVMDRFDEWPADGWYRQLLARLFEASESERPAVLLVADEMPSEEPNVIRDYYRDSGIVATVMFHFKLTKRSEFLYVSLNFGEPRPTAKDPDGVVRTLEHSDDTKALHLARARELYDNPERIRSKIRRLQTLWVEY